MKASVILSILLLYTGLFTAFGQAKQDSILLLNGKVLHGDVLGFELTQGDSILKYESTNKKGKKRIEIISTYRIFSYTADGISNTLYRQDEFSGNYLTEQETKEVTIGSYDARKTFKPHFPVWSSFVLGFGASVFDTYLTKNEANDSTLIAPKTPGFFKGNPSIFPFLVPVVTTVSWSFPSFKLRDRKIIHKKYFNNENFYRGYHRIAKQKRMLGALLGSLGGIATGMLIHYSVQ